MIDQKPEIKVMWLHYEHDDLPKNEEVLLYFCASAFCINIINIGKQCKAPNKKVNREQRRKKRKLAQRKLCTTQFKWR